MAIRVQCSNPECRKVLKCAEEHAGQTVKCPACGTALQVPAGGQPARKTQGIQTLGDYKLLRKLGEGGMGAVYEAEHLKHERKVALKVLPQKFTKDPVFLERFQREAKSAAALNHSNVIQLYDIGEDKGFHFFGMEFVDGESAQDLLKRETKLPPDDALKIVEGVAKALQYAYAHQIIHRDIKPDNIMLRSDGEVKLADLGLAKKLDDADHSVTHGVKGTCKVGPNDRCADPRLGPLSGDSYGMVPRSGSPAIDTGLKVGGAVPDHDFNRQKRPKGKGVDRGAFEVE